MKRVAISIQLISILGLILMWAPRITGYTYNYNTKSVEIDSIPLYDSQFRVIGNRIDSIYNEVGLRFKKGLLSDDLLARSGSLIDSLKYVMGKNHLYQRKVPMWMQHRRCQQIDL